MTQRTRLFVDKLSFTYPVASHKRPDVRMFFEGAAGMYEFFPFSDPGRFLNYRHAGVWKSADEDTHHGVSVYVEPRAIGQQPERRFLRFELNPANFNAGIIYRIYERLRNSLGLESFDQFMDDLRITRIDLAFDVAVDIKNLAVFYLLRKTNFKSFAQRVCEFSPQGMLNSMVFGLRESDKRLQVYDKRRERLNAANRSIFTPSTHSVRYGPGLQRPLIRRIKPLTRFELQLNDVGSFLDLLEMSNQFEKYFVKEYRILQIHTEKFKDLFFLDSCRFRGAHAALSLIQDKRTRAKYASAMKSIESPDWWNTQLIWAELVGAAFDLVTSNVCRHE